MSILVLNQEHCERLALETLGLGGSGVDLFSTEGIAANLRRAASFLCPCPPRKIVDVVLEALAPLLKDVNLPREAVSSVLDLLIAGGDLIELRAGDFRMTRLVYLGPPVYVEKEAGSYLIAGVRPYGASLLDTSTFQVRCEGHTRVVDLDPSIASDEFRTFGLTRVSPDVWVGCPSSETASSLIGRIRTRLDAAAPSGVLTELKILDQEARVTFYKGRWRDLNPADGGDFVGRRPQAFGADLWCVVRAVGGVPQAVIDFPIDDALSPGRDEAWRLQAAIDAEAGKPQVFRVVPAEGSEGDLVLDFFSPLPGWAERRLQLVGTSVNSQSGGLFSFRISASAATDLTSFLNQMLWMVAMAREGSP